MLKKKDGSLIPCFIFLTFCPFIEQEPIMVCLIRFRRTHENFIVLNQNGLIETYTHGLHKSIFKNYSMPIDMKEIFKPHKKENQSYLHETTSFGGSTPHHQQQSVYSKYRVNNYLLNTKDTTPHNHPSYILNDNDEEIVVITAEAKRDSFECEDEDGNIYKFSYKNIPFLASSIKVLAVHEKEKKLNIAPKQVKLEFEEPVFDIPEERTLNLIDLDITIQALQPPQEIKQVIKHEDFFSSDDSSINDESDFDVNHDKNIGDTSSVNSMLTIGHALKRQENLIYEVPKEKRTRILRIIMRIVLLISCILLILHQVLSNQNLSKAKEDTNILLTVSQLMVMATEISRRIRMLSLISEKLLDVTRQAVNNQPNIQKGIIGLLYTHAQFISQLNTNLRSGLRGVDHQFQLKIKNQSIAFIDRDANHVTRYVDVFTLTTEITNSLLRLSKQNANLLTSNNSDIRFVLNNTIDSYLISMESIVDILNEDPKIKLDEIHTIIISFLITSLLLGVLLMIYFFYIQNDFIKQRNFFILIFSKIENWMVEEYLQDLRRIFDMMITGQKPKHKHIMLLKSQKSSAHPQAKRNGHNNDNKRRLDMSGINRTFSILTALMLAFILVILLGFVALEISFNSAGNKETIIDQIASLKKISIYYYQIRILGTTMYSYIGERTNLTLRTKPFGPEWEVLYKDTTNFQQFLRSVADNQRSSQEMKSLISGNLCSWFTSPINYTSCLTFGAGTTQRGLLGINSWMLYTLRIVKDYFDGSNKTWTAQRTTLDSNNLITMEALIGNWMIPGYLKVQQLFIDQLGVILRDYEDLTMRITVLFIVIYFLLGLSLEAKVQEMMTSERESWRKIIRIIPGYVIMANKGIKNYLAKCSSKSSSLNV